MKNDEIRKEIENIPGGFGAVLVGVAIAMLIGILGVYNIILGITAICVVGLLLFLYVRNILKVPEEFCTVLCATLAALPVIICFFCIVWLFVSLVSWLILLLL